MQAFQIFFTGLMNQESFCTIQTKEPFIIEGSRTIIRKSSTSLLLVEDNPQPCESVEPPFLYIVETCSHMIHLMHSGWEKKYLRIENGKILTNLIVLDVIEDPKSNLSIREVRIRKILFEYKGFGGLRTEEIEIIPNVGLIIK